MVNVDGTGRRGALCCAGTTLSDLLQAGKLLVALKLARLSCLLNGASDEDQFHLNKSGPWGIAFERANLLSLKRQPDVVE